LRILKLNDFILLSKKVSGFTVVIFLQKKTPVVKTGVSKLFYEKLYYWL